MGTGPCWKMKMSPQPAFRGDIDGAHSQEQDAWQAVVVSEAVGC